MRGEKLKELEKQVSTLKERLKAETEAHKSEVVALEETVYRAKKDLKEQEILLNSYRRLFEMTADESEDLVSFYRTKMERLIIENEKKQN